MPHFEVFHAIVSFANEESKKYHNTLVVSTHVCEIILKFCNFHFDEYNIVEGSIFFFTNFCYLKKFKNFNIFENNTISVEFAKVIRYM